MFGLLFIVSGAGILLSFFSGVLPLDQGGSYLELANELVVSKIGNLGFLAPFVLFALGAHFFNSRKLKLVKSRVSIGLVLVFTTLLGAFRSGDWGAFVNDSLTADFSPLGTFTILIVAFLIGSILLLDTSLDAFVIFLATIAKGLVTFVKHHLLREMLSDKKDKKIVKEKEFPQKDNFIKGMTAPKLSLPGLFGEQKIKTSPAVSVTANKDFTMRPMNVNNQTWVYPPMSLLRDVSQQGADRGDTKQYAQTIEDTLGSFGVGARVDEVNGGPTVTQYALQIKPGTKLSKITTLSSNLALALSAPTGQVRIEAPIPGKALVGIEIPNNRAEIVTLKRLLNDPLFKNNPDPLLVPLGLDVSGMPQAASLSKMPHALVAGATNSGKSVMLNAWISTLLFRTKPEEVRLILVDPKRVELSIYNGVPHLLQEVIVDPDKIINALSWTVGEMKARYEILAKVHARNLEAYNAIPNIEKKPYIVFVIDELADLMMHAHGDAEDLITKIAQMARAVGIHLVLATQRPSVDVITGLMKANIPTRIAFNVSSLVDSRVVIDTPGAEKLLGRGDMLYLPPDQAKPRRIQGPFVTESEVQELVSFLRNQNPVTNYTTEVTEPSNHSRAGGVPTMGGGSSNQDPHFREALDLINQSDKASASLLQRKLKVGYSRAARILDELQEAGYVGPASGSKPREILRRGAIAETSEQPEE